MELARWTRLNSTNLKFKNLILRTEDVGQSSLPGSVPALAARDNLKVVTGGPSQELVTCYLSPCK